MNHYSEFISFKRERPSSFSGLVISAKMVASYHWMCIDKDAHMHEFISWYFSSLVKLLKCNDKIFGETKQDNFSRCHPFNLQHSFTCYSCNCNNCCPFIFLLKNCCSCDKTLKFLSTIFAYRCSYRYSRECLYCEHYNICCNIIFIIMYIYIIINIILQHIL